MTYRRRRVSRDRRSASPATSLVRRQPARRSGTRGELHPSARVNWKRPRNSRRQCDARPAHPPSLSTAQPAREIASTTKAAPCGRACEFVQAQRALQVADNQRGLGQLRISRSSRLPSSLSALRRQLARARSNAVAALEAAQSAEGAQPWSARAAGGVNAADSYEKHLQLLEHIAGTLLNTFSNISR